VVAVATLGMRAMSGMIRAPTSSAISRHSAKSTTQRQAEALQNST